MTDPTIVIVSVLALIVAMLSAGAAWSANRKSDKANYEAIQANEIARQANAQAIRANEIAENAAETAAKARSDQLFAWNLHKEDGLHYVLQNMGLGTAWNVQIELEDATLDPNMADGKTSYGIHRNEKRDIYLLREDGPVQARIIVNYAEVDHSAAIERWEQAIYPTRLPEDPKIW